MFSIERSRNIEDWERELGIQVPIASVVIQEYNPSLPAVGTKMDNTTPGRWQYTWATSPLYSEGLPTAYFGVAVIDGWGELSDIGLALPVSEESKELPFCFYWRGSNTAAEVTPVQKVKIDGGKRGLIDQFEQSENDRVVELEARKIADISDLNGGVVWRLGHPFVSSQVLREEVDVFYLGKANINNVLLSGISRLFLASGRLNRRASIFKKLPIFLPREPFDMLLGRNLVGIHHLWGSRRSYLDNGEKV